MKLNTLPCFPNLFWFQTCTSQQLVSSSIWWYIPVIIFDSLPFPPSWDPFSVVHLFLLKRKKKKKLDFSQHLLWLQISPKYYHLLRGLCSTYFAGLNIYSLKFILHRVISVTFCKHKYKNAASLHKTFQLLPIIMPIKFKTCIIVYKFLNNLWLLVTS